MAFKTLYIEHEAARDEFQNQFTTAAACNQPGRSRARTHGDRPQPIPGTEITFSVDSVPQLSIMDIWKQHMPDCPASVAHPRPWIPNRLLRAFRNPKGQLSAYLGNSVEVVDKWVGARRKPMLQLVQHNNAFNGVNHMLVLVCWADLLVWQKELLEGKDDPFLEVLERHAVQRSAGLGRSFMSSAWCKR
ncbi:hypothetical protein QQX98_011521 [Neonectria punicea]|uniref:Uncharacterized protein n=1 Tax=Neonectria punicea TaxID=979145 RepID=A0ABR1GLG9_9HYPO